MPGSSVFSGISEDFGLFYLYHIYPMLPAFMFMFGLSLAFTVRKVRLTLKEPTSAAVIQSNALATLSLALALINLYLYFRTDIYRVPGL